MTPRERILATLSHEPPDRIPTDGWFHAEVVETLKRHFDTDSWPAVLRELGIEGWVELSPTLMPPGQRRTDDSGHSLASGTPCTWLDDDSYEDIWGVRFSLGAGADTGVGSPAPCSTPARPGTSRASACWRPWKSASRTTTRAAWPL